MKRIVSFLCAVLSLVSQTHAVLTGDDINQTLVMLNQEQRDFAVSVDSISRIFAAMRVAYQQDLDHLCQDADAVSVMLYSQNDTYIFGQAYAAERVEGIVKRFDGMKRPLYVWLRRYDQNLQRCERLRSTLLGIDSLYLTDDGARQVEEGLQRLDGILGVLNEWHVSISADSAEFERVGDRIARMHSDALDYYKALQARAFTSSDKDYNAILANFGEESRRAFVGLRICTNPSVYGRDYQAEWASVGNLIWWTDVILFLLGFAAGIGLVYYWYHKHPARYVSYHVVTGWLLGWIFVTIANLFLRAFVVTNPFYQSMLLICVEGGLMCVVILVSVALRVGVRLVRRTLACYLPTILVTFVTLGMRMTLADSSVLNFFFVPVLVIVSALQIVVNRLFCRMINKFDCTMSLISFAVYSLSLVMAWSGFYLVSVQIVTLWTIVLSSVLLMSLARGFVSKFENRMRASDPDYDGGLLAVTLHNLVIPATFIGVGASCIYECAHIFNLVEWVNHLLNVFFVDRPGSMRISLLRLLSIALLGIGTQYVLKVLRIALRSLYGRRSSLGAMGMGVQICTIVVWGVFVVVSLAIIEVNSVGLLAVVSGVMVGIGIALRDTLDCFFCGITMMMGRVKIGDFVECDGVRGWVKDIQYRTTLIQAESGALISFFNTAFFGKNYKNLTGMGKYECMDVSFKLQKDADVRQLREVFLSELRANVPDMLEDPAPQILFMGTERFHINLMARVWLPVEDYTAASSRVRETIFYTFKKLGISSMLEDKRTIKLEK